SVRTVLIINHVDKNELLDFRFNSLIKHDFVCTNINNITFIIETDSEIYFIILIKQHRFIIIFFTSQHLSAKKMNTL
ncbi:hypothetical protein ACJX0J_010925, partial [Zea mays]